MSWLADSKAPGRRVRDWTDAMKGVVLDFTADCALVRWDDGTESWREADFLEFVEVGL